MTKAISRLLMIFSLISTLDSTTAGRGMITSGASAQARGPQRGESPFATPHAKGRSRSVKGGGGWEPICPAFKKASLCLPGDKRAPLHPKK